MGQKHGSTMAEMKRQVKTDLTVKNGLNKYKLMPEMAKEI